MHASLYIIIMLHCGLWRDLSKERHTLLSFGPTYVEVGLEMPVLVDKIEVESLIYSIIPVTVPA
jgi:hypothetical protein